MVKNFSVTADGISSPKISCECTIMTNILHNWRIKSN